jgi:hypothetical protein
MSRFGFAQHDMHKFVSLSIAELEINLEEFI